MTMTMAWGELGEVVRLAVHEMRQQEVPVTARKVERVVNTVAQAGDQRVQEIDAALKGTGCFAVMDDRGEVVGVFSSPASPETGAAPGATLSPARRHELEQQLSILRRLAEDRQSSASARTRAAQEAAKIEKLLQLPSTAS